jgi:hypothetical protein
MGVFVESDRSSSFQPGHVTDQQLLERWHRERDAAAREALVRHHLSLARKLAERYSHTQDGPSESIFMPRNPRVRPVIAFATGRFRANECIDDSIVPLVGVGAIATPTDAVIA